MYYEENNSRCSGKRYTLNQPREMIEKSNNTAERRNIKYQRKARERGRYELGEGEEKLEQRK